MDLKELKELIRFISKLEVGEFEIENGDLRIYMSKNSFVNISGKEIPQIIEEKKEPPAEIKVIEEPKVIEEKKEETVKGSKITAPIVGTFYEAPAPGSEPFVRVGDIVKKGQTLCIIEAMKVMNEVKAGMSGTVAEILVENAHPVEFGTKIIRIV